MFVELPKFQTQIFKNSKLFISSIFLIDSNMHPHTLSSSQNAKTSESTRLEDNNDLRRYKELDPQQLLQRIYQNIYGPNLINKKSLKLIQYEESNLSEDSTNLKCNCKKTKCLKLYCECFGKGQYCNGCNCEGCNNSAQFDVLRSRIIDEIIQKNPNAFDAEERTKNVGCICKKTGCLKKYCQCYNLGKKCGQQCKCVNCLNIDK